MLMTINPSLAQDLRQGARYSVQVIQVAWE